MREKLRKKITEIKKNPGISMQNVVSKFQNNVGKIKIKNEKLAGKTNKKNGKIPNEI